MKKQKAQAYEIEHTLVLSTGHITAHDDILLTKLDDTPLEPIVDQVAFGYRIYVGHEKLAETKHLLLQSGISMAMFELLLLASKLKCTWLTLDADGPLRNDLPKFDW